MHGPVTQYTFVDGRVWQQNRNDGGMLEKPELERLRPEWTEPGNVYYYSIQKLNLWGTPHASVKELIDQVRQLQSRHRAGTLITEAPLR
jgi:ferritin-like protein